MWRRLLTDVLMYHLAAGPETLRHTAAEAGQMSALELCSAPSVSQSVFTITEKAPTKAAFTFKTL